MASALNVFSHPEYCSFYFFLYKYLPLIFLFVLFRLWPGEFGLKIGLWTLTLGN